MRTSLGFVPLAFFALTSAASAADFDPAKCNLPRADHAADACVCVIAYPATAKSPVALLQDVKGQVLKSDQGGFSPVVDTTALHIGDKVLLESNGQGLLLAGVSCNQTIGPNASLIVTQIDNNCACAALEQKAASVVPADPGILAAALGAGTIAGLIGLASHPHPASP